MKWMFRAAAVAGVLSAALLLLGYTTDLVPEPPDTVEIEPEQIEREIEDVGDEANEAVGKVMPDAMAEESGIDLE